MAAGAKARASGRHTGMGLHAVVGRRYAGEPAFAVAAGPRTTQGEPISRSAADVRGLEVCVAPLRLARRMAVEPASERSIAGRNEPLMHGTYCLVQGDGWR